MEARGGQAPHKPQNFLLKKKISKKKKFKILHLNFLIFLVLPPLFFSFQFGPSIFTGLGPPLDRSIIHGWVKARVTHKMNCCAA
jgi:hypothetical protein